MKSIIYWSAISHQRFAKARHAFKYNVYVFGLDLAELPSLNSFWPFFGFDRAALFSVKSRDYLGSYSGTLGQRLNAYSKEIELPEAARVVVITAPRYLGLGFNPVTFFLCYGENQNLLYVLAEVHNTFGETFVYPLRNKDQSSGITQQYAFGKEFYVSPFFDVSGDYKLSVTQSEQNLAISVDLYRDKELQFAAMIAGTGRQFSRRNMTMTFIRFPISGLLTMLRIEFEALRLYFKRHLRPEKKPIVAPSPLQSNSPSIFDHFRRRAIDYGRDTEELSGKIDDKPAKP